MRGARGGPACVLRSCVCIRHVCVHVHRRTHTYGAHHAPPPAQFYIDPSCRGSFTSYTVNVPSTGVTWTSGAFTYESSGDTFSVKVRGRAWLVSMRLMHARVSGDTFSVKLRDHVCVLGERVRARAPGYEVGIYVYAYIRVGIYVWVYVWV